MASAGCGGGGQDVAAGADVVGRASQPAGDASSPDRTASDGAQVVSQVLLTGSSTRVLAGPLGDPQGLDDFGSGIEPWGPVTALHTVTLADQSVHVVKQLASPDPFTATYQLANGDIVVSNEPLGEIVTFNGSEPTPATVMWTGPDNTPIEIVSGEIVVTFYPTVSEQQIWDFIDLHDLHVVMSWFEPNDSSIISQGLAGGASTGGDGSASSRGVSSAIGYEGNSNDSNNGGLEEAEGGGGGITSTGNSVAWFQFQYDQNEFPQFDQAYSYFSSNLLIEQAVPNFYSCMGSDYSPDGNPNDTYYIQGNDLWINSLELDTSSNIPLVPYPGVK
jgi:hypothetical protein